MKRIIKYLSITLITLVAGYLFSSYMMFVLRKNINEDEAIAISQERVRNYCKTNNLGTCEFILQEVIRNYPVHSAGGGVAYIYPWHFEYISVSVSPRHRVSISIGPTGVPEMSSLVVQATVWTEEQAGKIAAEDFHKHCETFNLNPASFAFRSIKWTVPSNTDALAGKPWKEPVWIVSYVSSTTRQSVRVSVSRFGSDRTETVE